MTLLHEGWPAASPIQGVLVFGSRAGDHASERSDWDIGVVHDGPAPEVRWPENWDVFAWSLEHWRRGFALQLELSRNARILHDPRKIIGEKLDYLREYVLPRFDARLKRIQLNP